MNRSSAAKAHKVEPTAEVREVKIIYDRSNSNPQQRISVEPNVFWVSKGNCEQVRWYCVNRDGSLPAPDFTVDFDRNGSPFNEKHFNRVVPLSGLVRRDVLPDDHKIYKYNVQIGDTILDPGGGVKA